MEFKFSGNGLSGKDRVLQRFFEILPGATSWTVLIGMTALALTKPLFAAVIIIAFYFYWLLRLLYMTLFLILSYSRLSMEKSTDWMARVAGLNRIDEYLEELKKSPLPGRLGRRWSQGIHRKEVESLKSSGAVIPNGEDIYQLAIIPVAKEPREVVEPGIRSLAEGTFPPERVVVMLALEERASEEIKKGT